MSFILPVSFFPRSLLPPLFSSSASRIKTKNSSSVLSRQEALLERVRRRGRHHPGRKEQSRHGAAGGRDAVLRDVGPVQQVPGPLDPLRHADAQPRPRLPAVLLRADAQLRVEQGELLFFFKLFLPPPFPSSREKRSTKLEEEKVLTSFSLFPCFNPLLRDAAKGASTASTASSSGTTPRGTSRASTRNRPSRASVSRFHSF